MKSDKQRANMLRTLKCLTIGKAKENVAREFQRMIRWEWAAEHDGLLHCCTCEYVEPIDAIGQGKFDSGHFIGGRRAALIFDERNCHPQCKRCNQFHSGRPDRYEAFMFEQYGKDVVEELRSLKSVDARFTHEELLELKLQFMSRTAAAKRRLMQ